MSPELTSKLAQLKELHQAGLLSTEAYTQQQQVLVASFMGTGGGPGMPPIGRPDALAGATQFFGPSNSGHIAHGGHPLTGATTVGPGSFPTQLGSYRVLGIVGTGGMGTVVRARHLEEGWAAQQGGDVAIKLIHPHIAAAPEFRARFLAEAALGRRVQHPGLVPTWDVITDGPWLGTVMSFVEGEPLTSRIRPGGIPVDEALAILGPIAETLDYLHAQGIVHRDIKPGNIVIRPDGRPVVLDLGIAKDAQAASHQTRTMMTMGTSAWMAPEQADAKHVDGAADRYALGLIAYALISGRLPWGEEETELRVLTHKMMGQLTPLTSVKADVAPEVADTVMRMIAVVPEKRFDTCRSFVDAASAASAHATRDQTLWISWFSEAHALTGAATPIPTSDRVVNRAVTPGLPPVPAEVPEPEGPEPEGPGPQESSSQVDSSTGELPFLALLSVVAILVVGPVVAVNLRPPQATSTRPLSALRRWPMARRPRNRQRRRSATQHRYAPTRSDPTSPPSPHRRPYARHTPSTAARPFGRQTRIGRKTHSPGVQVATPHHKTTQARGP